MKKKLFLFLPIILIELFCNSIVFSQCGDDGYYKIGEQFASKRLVYNCNYTFHCHKFVRMYFESNCEKPTWNSPLNSICSWNPAQYEFPNTNYWNLNTYIKVAVQDANIARYQRSQGGIDHSQVKDSQYSSYPQKYISKYDFGGPVVGHNLGNSFYDITRSGGTYTYYFYLGKITGNPQITSTSPVYFSLNANTGVTYTWTVSQSGSIVSLSAGSSPNIIKVTAIQNGSATLNLTATTNVGGSVSQSIDLSVAQLPPPLLSGTYDNGGINNQTLLTANHVSVGSVFIRVSYPEATNYTWQKISGNINGYFAPGSTTSFNMTSGGSITLLVTAKNGSVTLTSRTITFYNYSW